MTVELRAERFRREDAARQAELSRSLKDEYSLLEHYCDLCLRAALAGAVVGIGLVALLGRLP